MSTFKVPLTKILEIFPHPNADRLEFARVYDFRVVVQKDKYRVNDEVIYVPIDSILPEDLERMLFGPESKIKLHNHRVKQIRIRGAYSQGMLINPADIPHLHLGDVVEMMEKDVSDILRITKYEPPASNYQSGPAKKRDKPLENPYFHKYGGLDNFKWYPDLFGEGEMVSVTEKIHGSHIRCGWAPYATNSWFKRLVKRLGLAPSHEWVYGSNNVQLQARTKWWRLKKYQGYYGNDVYGKALEKYGIKDKLRPGEMLYGELYGDGIQKDYNYGCAAGEHKLVWFDLKRQTETSTEYASVDDFQDFCEARGLDMAPEIYRGEFRKESIKELTKGDSVLAPSQKVREGVVIKPLTEQDCYMGRKVLKLISEKYLEADNTDFH